MAAEVKAAAERRPRPRDDVGPGLLRAVLLLVGNRLVVVRQQIQHAAVDLVDHDRCGDARQRVHSGQTTRLDNDFVFMRPGSNKSFLHSNNQLH